MVFRATAAAADFFERLAVELDVPVSRYEEAERRYHSVGEWLGRDESTLRDHSPNVYVQGSFRLGTPIRPINDAEHYDIDLVCELSLGKHNVTQKELKQMLGKEMQLYAKRYQMSDAAEGRRCWTLDYAEGAQFHLDALPAIPDGEGRRIALASMHLSSDWSHTSIAITDTECETFAVRSPQWPHSNPVGFTNWFHSRMKVAFDDERKRMAFEALASVEDVPVYEVKTPLQQAVQILKRHRDVRFVDEPDIKPISVIITTLAAKSYANQRDLSEAIAGILENMHQHIELRSGVYWIENPTDPAENFADRWQTQPERKDAFFKWLALAQRDFRDIAEKKDLQMATEAASVAVGDDLARKVRAGMGQPHAKKPGSTLLQQVANIFTAPHRKLPPWGVHSQGTVQLARVRAFQNGFRPETFKSNAPPLPKGIRIEFAAQTDVPKPYDIFWQIVNTGHEAQGKSDLRGDFNLGVIVKGEIVHTESTAYSGIHSVECFVVKNSALAARSGVFIVNVK